MEVEIRELAAHELPQMRGLIQLLNPGMDDTTFYQRLQRLQHEEYRALGAFDGGRLIGVCGFKLFTRFWCGRQLDLDNFIIEESARGQRIGERMLRWLERFAQNEGCDIIVFDTYVTSTAAQRFYHREGYSILGFHFVKKLP